MGIFDASRELLWKAWTESGRRMHWQLADCLAMA